ncbi:MAG: cobalamin biosynthesis protein CobQ [Oscillospiraceae bacterium]|nr:cobalamin biosynthesis protein CobQ [Oscillospiraceae bacterium]
MDKITVGWMYPNLLNLHGERGSVQALVAIGKQLGIEIQVKRIEDFDDPIPFEELDLLIFLPGEIAMFRHLIPALQASAFGEYLEKDGYVLVLGTTGLMFGKTITREDDSVINGLGYLDMDATERKYVWGDDLHFRLNDTDMELAGSQIQMADVDAKQPLGTTVYGMGNNNTGAEGARYKNLIYTNCLGPLFVKNPWFGEYILKGIMRTKGVEISAEGCYPVAKASFDATLKFINEKPKK